MPYLCRVSTVPEWEENNTFWECVHEFAVSISFLLVHCLCHIIHSHKVCSSASWFSKLFAGLRTNLVSYESSVHKIIAVANCKFNFQCLYSCKLLFMSVKTNKIVWIFIGIAYMWLQSRTVCNIFSSISFHIINLWIVFILIL